MTSAASDEAQIKEYTAQIQQMRESAKHLTGLTSVLPTLYFAVLSFSDLRQTVQGLEALPFLLPAVPWLACVLLTAHIPLPQRLHTQTAADRMRVLDALSRSYYLRLRWAYWCLAGGLLLLLLVLGYYLAFVPPPSA